MRESFLVTWYIYIQPVDTFAWWRPAVQLCKRDYLRLYDTIVRQMINFSYQFPCCLAKVILFQKYTKIFTKETWFTFSHFHFQNFTSQVNWLKHQHWVMYHNSILILVQYSNTSAHWRASFPIKKLTHVLAVGTPQFWSIDCMPSNVQRWGGVGGAINLDGELVKKYGLQTDFLFSVQAVTG